jgi:hypothetical protein
MAQLMSFVALGALALGATAAHAETNYDRVVAKLRTVQAAHPDTTTLVSLGKNDQGTDIWGLRIAGRGVDAGTERLVVGTHHGNEGKSVDVALQFVDDAVKRVETGLAPGTSGEVFHVFPVLNVTGYNANRREESLTNGRTVDSNRDYPDPCGNPSTYRLKSTKLLSDYLEAHGIVSAVTIHGYAGTFTYPWGTYTDTPATLDNDEFDRLGRLAVAADGYDTGTHGELIYPTVGAFEDWAYFAHGIWVGLIELANNPNAVKDSDAIMRYLTNAPLERSAQHESTGRCTNFDRAKVRARP